MFTALLSVSDKTGLVDFARGLAGFGVKLLSTGGTAKLLQQAGLEVTEVADYTGFPEMLDGRVKTLHPKVHGGILARRDSAAHLAAIGAAGIPTIDLVVVNLYPFGATVARPDCTLDKAIENIDIGGPAMVRSAAKNYRHVAVVTDPADYAPLLEEMAAANGAVGADTRFRLARKAFSHTAAYDGAISNYLTARDASGENVQRFPERLNLQLELAQPLRYGENPHQHAAFYRDPDAAPGTLARYRQVQGKALSYNNIADSDAAWACVSTFDAPACVIVKHANPCGVAIAGSPAKAYKKAFSTDPTSAFGGIIAFNREVDEAAAKAVAQQFVEVVIAPAVSAAAAAVFSEKANIRVLEVEPADAANQGGNALDYKRVGGGLLVQTPDALNVSESELKVVTALEPTPEQRADLLFAWRVAKFVKSNAIVFCGNGQTLGVGAGQMSRVDSARIASIKAENAGLTLTGSAVASDAFFPFRDGVDVVAQAGARAIIQPGGSVRDAEVIEAANEQGIAMVFTGVRHFRH
ncbi:MAG: cyclohydrolase / phosphoribosylaminoimidazolecarboxamide formyltransferase [Betaproteobacteria bacterium]|nr:cyclohydrolase / phosphoribosylaminoimidazolecarboxamide formyltransferase [Betaproteobacteria bacterium]